MLSGGLSIFMLHAIAAGVKHVHRHRHLDLACGRGGDVFKWAEADIPFIRGVDVSDSEVDFARRRTVFAQDDMRSGKRVNVPNMDYKFFATPDLGLVHINIARQFDAPRLFHTVGCMFALHYFFATAECLDNFLHNVSKSLCDGGFFYGTVPLAPRILELLSDSTLFENSLLRIRQRWVGAPQPFGAAYTFAILDTVTNDAGAEGLGDGCEEFLVDPDVLSRCAAKHGLLPVRSGGDDDFYAPSRSPWSSEGHQAHLSHLEPVGSNPALRYFRPDYASTAPGPDAGAMETVSRLYASFVFQKCANNPAVSSSALAAATITAFVPTTAVPSTHTPLSAATLPCESNSIAEKCVGPSNVAGIALNQSSPEPPPKIARLMQN